MTEIDNDPVEKIVSELKDAQSQGQQEKYLRNLEIGAYTFGEGDERVLLQTASELEKRAKKGQLTEGEMREIAKSAVRSLKPDEEK